MAAAQLVPLSLSLVSIVGMYGSYLFGKHTKRFKWSEYLLLTSFPVLCALSLSFFYGMKVVYLFLLSSVIGLILEYSTGRIYHKTLNKRLWVYDRMDLHGYTSILVLPLWGVAGIVFWMLSMSLGL